MGSSLLLTPFFPWVLDLDIKGFFDNISHELLMKAVTKHTECRWVLLYVERWLKAPVAMLDRSFLYPEKGTPQGWNGESTTGKSTVLNALNILFRNTQAASNVVTLDEEDFHLRNVNKPITITATFTDLSEKAKKDLKAYVRQDKLILSAKAEWNQETRTAEVQQFGSRETIKDFAKCFRAEKEGAKATKLKGIFKGIREKYPDIDPAATKDAMQQALRKYEEEHPNLCEPVESSDQFYGWSKGANILEQHCQ